MKTRDELIFTPIETIMDAEAFIVGLWQNDLMFHFEDDPADLCGDPFTEAEARLLRDRVDELYALEWGVHECPIGYALFTREWATAA